MKIPLLEGIRKRLHDVDVYVTRRAQPTYRKGMRTFWWYGFFISMAAAFEDTYIALYVLALGATRAQVGWLSSLSSFMGMLAPIPGAQWAARWGKRREVVVISFGVRRLILLLAILTPFFLSGPTAVIVIIALLALRVGISELGSPAWTSLSGDIVPLELRGRYFSSRKTVMSLATLLFVPLAGQIIEWFRAPYGYQVVFSISIAAALVALYLYAQIPEPRMAAPAAQGRPTATFIHALTHNRTFLMFTLIAVAWNFAVQLAGPYFSVYQVEVLKTTPKVIGALSIVSSITDMIGQQVWGRVIDKRGSRWTLAVCAFLIPFLPLIWAVVSKPWHVIFISLPSGFLWAGYHLANFNLLLELPDKAHQTQAVASYTTLIGFVNILGPLVGSWMIDWAGYRWDFVFSTGVRWLAVILLVLLLNPFGKPRRQKNEVDHDNGHDNGHADEAAS